MNRQHYRQLSNVFQAMREHHADFPIGAMMIFIELAMDDGLTLADLIHRTGLHQSAASRLSRKLTEWQKPGVEGYGFAEWRPSPTDFRSKMLHMNKSGYEFLAKIEAAMRDI